MSVIAGRMAPAKGYVEINGLRRRQTDSAELQIRKQVAVLPDQTWLPEFKTGREWLTAIGELYDLDPEHLMDHIVRLLDLFYLTDKGESPIRTYSNGQKKKLAICGALVTEAPILILDEPFTGGLDAAAILALSRVLRHLADLKNTTILMASQIGEMVDPIAHRLAILEGTRLKAYDTLEELRKRTGCSGSLAEVFEKLVHPHPVGQVRFRPPLCSRFRSGVCDPFDYDCHRDRGIQRAGAWYAIITAGAFAVVWFLLLTGGPSMRRWVLTGQHRYRPATKATARRIGRLA